MIALLAGMALGAEWIVGQGPQSVQAAVAMAAEGDTIVLGPGEWDGPVVIDKAVTLTSRGGVLVGTRGTTLRIAAPGTVIESLVLRGSGDDLMGPDACIRVEPEATGTVIERSRLTDCLFGIWLHEVHHVRLVDNYVLGRPDERPPSKGNGIHLFDSADLVVTGNVVEGARDGIYVSATEDSVIAGNTVSKQRYGIHYMFSHDNVIENNICNDNSGGIALMQSRRLVVRGNESNDNKRHGILFRDVVDSQILGNRTERNAEGLFFFSSVRNEIVGNTIAGNQIGARVWAGTEDNDIHGNAFVANAQQVFFVSATDQQWGSNYWSDYLGWDQDGDGRGDRPYRNDAFVAQLLHRYPHAVLLMNSPTLELLNGLQAKLPALAVPTVEDAAPLTSPPLGAL